MRLVHGQMRWYLVRGRAGQSNLGMRQLLANWGRLGDIAGSEGPPRKLPAAWIRPLVSDIAPPS